MMCYVCKTPSVFFIRKNGYDLYRCPSCSLIQTQLGKPYDQFIKDFYTVGYYTGDDGAGAYKNYEKDKPYIVRNMRTILSRIRRIKPNGTLLDVGSAYGYFIELTLRNGFDAYGFDPSSHAYSKAPKKIRKRIQRHSVSEAAYKKQSFDVISLLDVFEHLADPISDLKKLRSFLKDDGIIVIATGDTGSLAARLLKRRWTFYIPPQHLFFFDKKTMTETLQRAGFAPLSFFRIGKWLSLSYVLHLASTSSESKLATLLLPVVEHLGLSRIPLYLPMGDNMVIIAKKSHAECLL